jgi:hypothetical protein
MLETLARDLGAEVPAADGAAEEPAPRCADVLAGQKLAHVGWLTLQRAAYAAGDKRIDRVVKPVLREKERHAGVLESCVARQATAGLFREPED